LLGLRLELDGLFFEEFRILDHASAIFWERQACSVARKATSLVAPMPSHFENFR